MPAATVNTNAPQAKDDVFNEASGFLVVNENVGEGTSGYAIRKVSLLANDLGGNSKSFYGLGAGAATTFTSDKGALLTFQVA